MKKILLNCFAVLLFLQISKAQNPDAKNLPLLIQDNEGGSGWSPDGNLFATYTETENKTKLWNLSTDAVIWEVSLNNQDREKDSLNFQTFVWSDNQKLLLVKDKRDKIYLLDTANGKIIWKKEISQKNLEIISFSPDEKQIIVIFSKENEKAKIEFWSVETGELKNRFSSDVKFFDAFSFSKNGKFLLFGNFEGKTAFINSSTGKTVKNIALKPCGNLSNTFSNETDFSPNLTYLWQDAKIKPLLQMWQQEKLFEF